MSKAIFRMIHDKKHNFKITSKTYAILREQYSLSLKGENNPMYGLHELHPCFGKVCSAETKKKISIANKGRKRTEQQKQNMKDH